jgi:hypothetical protein
VLGGAAAFLIPAVGWAFKRRKNAANRSGRKEQMAGPEV